MATTAGASARASAGARTLVARLIRKESASSVNAGFAPNFFRQSLVRLVPTALPVVSVLPSRTSSAPAASTPVSGPQVLSKKGKQSPHSKILRVCSKRNANSHFAAIEAELLRLDWDEAMDALVKDWRQRNRWDDLIELESNVRSYVNKNVRDLACIHKEHVREWERGGDAYRGAVTLADHLRFRSFPYEHVVSAMVHGAIAAGEVTPGDENKIAMAEIRERIVVLCKAGTLLDAMASFNLKEDVTKANDGGWTMHHTSCSKCYRSLLSGWFLLYRRLREANKKILADSADAADVLIGTDKLETHPEHEAGVWAEKWIELCTSESKDAESEVHVQGGKVLLGGILPTDKPLLAGIVKILSMSKDAKSQMQSVELDQQLTRIFLEE